MGGREKWGGPNVTTQRIYNRDVCLILAGSFFYMASSMLVTPLITGFAGSLGAGSALMGLIKLVQDAGATLVGAGICVEKAFQPGGQMVRDLGVRVESLARIQSMSEDGHIEFC